MLAAANSVFGRWDETKGDENIDFMPTILSRFDMIFIVKDEHNEERDMVGCLNSPVQRGRGYVGNTFFLTVRTMVQRLDSVKAYILFLLYNRILPKEGLDKECNSILSVTILENLANILHFLIKQS